MKVVQSCLLGGRAVGVDVESVVRLCGDRRTHGKNSATLRHAKTGAVGQSGEVSTAQHRGPEARLCATKGDEGVMG